jgi:cytosine/adenosine deaminase-related metal-dependent hydrolase
VTGGSLLIAGATLIDGSGAQPVRDAAVLTSGERIRYAGPSDGLPHARVDRVLDASGKFVVPGLIDLHTHSTFDADMRTYLKNGVTSIRFAGVSQAAVVAVRERIQRGEVTGPRIFSCGPMLDKSPPAYPQWTSTVNTPAEADRTARRLLSHDRVEALLVTQQITPDLLEPVVLAAHEFGRPVVGQVWATDGAQAARIGIDQLDNTSRIFASREYPTERLLAYRTVAERLALLGRGWAAVDWDLTRTIIDTMVELNVVHCPTLVVTQAQAQTITAELKLDWDYQTEFGAAEYQTWATFLAYIESTWTQADRDFLSRSIEMRLEWMRWFRASGGRLVSGTDMQFGGIMLHRELLNLQEVGLSAMEVIAAATSDAAIALRMNDALGSLEAGKLADLIVVNRDPCIDLRHLREISYVVKGGLVAWSR